MRGGPSSGWLKESDLVSSGLSQASFEEHFGREGRRRAMRAAVEALPPWLRASVGAVRARAMEDRLPLVTLLQAQPLQMSASHLTFQEFFAARAICHGVSLPSEPPWRWSAWWANTLRLGTEMGATFGAGLARAVRADGSLDLSAQLGGHRPTALAAVRLLVFGLAELDLSDNDLSAREVHDIAQAVRTSSSLTSLSLAKNPIGDEGACALAAVLLEGSSLTNLNLFGTGIQADGASALAGALAEAPSLKRLNLQYNALRGTCKAALEAANAARAAPLTLVL